MNSKTRKSFLAVLTAGMTMAVYLPVGAQSLNQVLDGQERRTRLAQESQERVDNIVRQTRSLEEEYKAVLKEIDGLEVYNTLLQRQVDNQELDMQDLDRSIDQVEVINRQIVPLMVRMIDSLEEFIELDVPFLLEERRNRVGGLRTLMERQDVTVAEKFRKVMEAYQIENEFGRTLEAYKDTLDIDGATKEVDVLRVGRIALLYQTTDGSLSGRWDQDQRQWVGLGNEHKNQIKFGLQIARKQVAPDLVLLPVPTPEAS